jgi:hypothetical protein
MGVKGKETFVAARAGKEGPAKKSSNKRVDSFCFIQLPPKLNQLSVFRFQSRPPILKPDTRNPRP